MPLRILPKGLPIPLPAKMAPWGVTGLTAYFSLLELGKLKVADMEALDLGPCDKNELHYDPKRKEPFDVKSLSNSCGTDWTE